MLKEKLENGTLGETNWAIYNDKLIKDYNKDKLTEEFKGLKENDILNYKFYDEYKPCEENDKDTELYILKYKESHKSILLSRINKKLTFVLLDPTYGEAQQEALEYLCSISNSKLNKFILEDILEKIMGFNKLEDFDGKSSYNRVIFSSHVRLYAIVDNNDKLNIYVNTLKINEVKINTVKTLNIRDKKHYSIELEYDNNYEGDNYNMEVSREKKIKRIVGIKKLDK